MSYIPNTNFSKYQTQFNELLTVTTLVK